MRWVGFIEYGTTVRATVVSRRLASRFSRAMRGGFLEGHLARYARDRSLYATTAYAEIRRGTD